LPDWFGIEAEIQRLAGEIDRLPTFTASRGDHLLGFLTLQQHFPESAEVIVMGVRQEAHRQGIGRALMEQAQEWLVSQGVEYLQIKTLGPSRPDEGYAGTRAFYSSLGFKPLEELSQIWDENNPCLMMVKKL
jgi:GNAT superfamily N-acetyltransferase